MIKYIFLLLRSSLGAMAQDLEQDNDDGVLEGVLGLGSSSLALNNALESSAKEQQLELKKLSTLRRQQEILENFLTTSPEGPLIQRILSEIDNRQKALTNLAEGAQKGANGDSKEILEGSLAAYKKALHDLKTNILTDEDIRPLKKAFQDLDWNNDTVEEALRAVTKWKEQHQRLLAKTPPSTLWTKIKRLLQNTALAQQRQEIIEQIQKGSAVLLDDLPKVLQSL